MRGLGGGENPSANSGRELHECEETCGIEVVLSRFVNHTQLPMLLGISIWDDLIKLTALQGCLITPIP
jgi:hypothetical protein